MFKRFLSVVAACVLFIPVSVFAEEKKLIKLCTDENFWAPYAFSYDGKSAGTNLEIADEALKRLGYRVEATPLSWQRCLVEARKGLYDIIVAASYRPERAVDFHYPDGADAAGISPYRITQASYVLVTRSGSRWGGATGELPFPLGVPKGYSIALELAQWGVDLVSAERYSHLFRMLKRQRVNGIIVLEPAAKMYLLDEAYKNDVFIHPGIYSSKSYYLIASRKGKLSLEKVKLLWEEVRNIRENNDKMYHIQTKVLRQLRRCLSATKDCKR